MPARAAPGNASVLKTLGRCQSLAARRGGLGVEPPKNLRYNNLRRAEAHGTRTP